MLLIGSAALQYHTCGGDDRKPRDFDYIVTHEDLEAFVKACPFDSLVPNAKGSTLVGHRHGEIFEFEIAWPGTSGAAILEKIDRSKLLWGMDGDIVQWSAPLNLLYLLKMSHRYLRNSPHFEKTRDDILFMRSLGAKIESDWADIYQMRMQETYDYAHPKLAQFKAGFFDPTQIAYRYDHDSIHEAMAVLHHYPAYKMFQGDAEVMVDRTKWSRMPFNYKLNSVLEEAYVLALERSIIPFRATADPSKAFKLALQKVCTSISSGWWREFAWEHYDKVLEMMDSNFVDKFDAGIANGVVKPFKGD